MTTETRISQELSRRAEHVQGPPLSLDGVRGRARSIQRRRRAAAGAVAAAVVLVVLAPFALSGGTGSTAPDPAPTPPVAPGASVLHDGVLTLPDGGTVELDVDNADVSQIGVLTDGRILVPTNQPGRLRVFSPDGELAAELPMGATLIRMTPDNDAATWLEGDGSVMVLSSGTPDPVELGAVEAQDPYYPMIDAVVDAEHVLVGDGNTTTTEVTPEGARPLNTSEPLRVTDVSPDGDLWAVQYQDDADPQFGCVGLYDPAAENMLARNCATAGLRFSPDGQHLLGMRGDNGMFGDATVFDLDLQQVGGWESEGKGDVIKAAAWDDAGHLLVSETNWQDSSWSLVRVDLSWSNREVLEGPLAGGDPERVNEFLLSE